MAIPLSPLFEKCISVAFPPEPFGLLEIVESKLSDFANGTNSWNLGVQLPATVAASTLVAEPVNISEVTIDVDDVLPFSLVPGFFILGDPLNATDFEIIEYLGADIIGQEAFNNCIRGQYGSAAKTHSDGADIEQLQWENNGGIVGNDLAVQPHRWTHKISGGLEPPVAFATDGIVGVVDSLGNVWAFHPTSTSLPVWKFDISAGTWTNPATTGTYIPVTSSLCVYDRSRNKIFILGGIDTAASNIATLQIFDVATLTFSTGTDTIKDGPLIGDYDETNDRVIYYTDDIGFIAPVPINTGRAYAYDISGDSHTAKAFHTDPSFIPPYDIEDDNNLADAVYNPNDGKIHFVGRLTSAGGPRRHRTYDFALDVWDTVGNPPIGNGTSYRVALFRDLNLLITWVRGFAPPINAGRFVFQHRIGTFSTSWTRIDDMFQARNAPIVGYDDESRSVVYFGGDALGTPSPFLDLVGPGFWRPFFQTTVYRTKVFDVLISDPGAPIIGDVIFLLDDIVPAFATVSYEAEHSDSAGGPFTSIGTVVDGQKEDIQKQFWRIIATMTVNGEDTLRISKIEVAYQTVKFWATNPQAVPASVATDIEGLILDLPIASGQTDIETGRGSVAGINIDIEDNIGRARTLQENGRLLDAEAKYSVGFNIPTFRKSDMMPIYTGTISAMDVNFGTVTLAIKDAKDYLRTKLPIGDDGTQPIPIAYDVGGISNPALVLRDILEQAGVPDRAISDGSFALAAAQPNALHDVRRIIEEPRELRKYFEEINRLIDGLLIADANGKLTYKIYDPTSLPVATIRPNEQNGRWEMSQEFSDKVNTATVYGDSSTEDGGEVLDYTFGAREQDGALVIKDGVVREDLVLGPWIGPDNATFDGLTWAREIAVRRLARKRIGVQRLKGSLIGLRHANLEEGDILRLVAESFFERPQSDYENSQLWPYSVEGQSFLRDNKWVVTRRKIDFVKGNVGLELARARAPLSVDITGESFQQAVILGGENIELNSSNEAVLVSGETVGFITILLDMDQCPDLVGDYTITNVIPSGAILTLTITPSHDGRFDPRFERTTPLTNAPLTSTTLLDGESKRRFYAFRLDFDEGSAGAGNGPTVSRIQVDHPNG